MMKRPSLKSIARPVRAMLMLSPAAAVVVGSGASATTPTEHSRVLDNDSSQRVSATSATPLCTPLFGTGKSVGVPIVAKDAGGSLITDISSYTFELSDGSQTQDVTAQIKRPEQSQLVTGHSSVAPASPNTFAPLQNNYNLYSQNDSATGPALSFTNPGYYFLDCTPDATSSTAKFGPNIVLRMKSGGVVVADVSLTGRGAVYHAIEDYGQFGGNTITTVAKPAGSSNGAMDVMYRDYLGTIGIPFRRTFAIEAMLEMSNSFNVAGDNSTYCWADLAVTAGATWSLTQLGEDFVNELTNATSSSTNQMLYDRTRGVSGASTCLLTNSSSEDELFMNILAAQLLLIDGPLGNVPQSVSSLNDALRPASVLQLAAPVTTTTVAASTTTTTPVPAPSTTAPSQTETPMTALPATGRSSGKGIALALLMLTSGIAVVTTRRRLNA
jgi:hypothetical protein